ncbi:hypothetical protein PSECIP111951_01126 [Pseudoalteromonas holothuriae]|uniref:Uncharacterized protein n=1 Tax=Pseudoalteromonas holothuriae TaxID=2963714 RepID=A0A9W4QXK8_9GAMM|nr:MULTISPECIES: hypothetical protein [unclassified Pseudoalteromonas]CAH9054867.1 hypothetical protein PSECIP111951_01126 [Pseudoalteromonas sp. CIP111951]CAH9057564.1 hypothetical protein PSECIP111854_02023 [Pseudoalteromonas sp. CIP111854]
MMTHITIKQVRGALKRWGKFWQSKELGKGFKRSSISEFSGKPSGGVAGADEMSVPKEIELITQLITTLRPECIRAIRARYIMTGTMAEAAKLVGFDSKRSAEFWLVKAERSLLAEFSASVDSV